MDLARCTLAEWIDALATRRPTPAGGALSFVTLAGAAALAAKVAELEGADALPWREAADALLSRAREDGEGYARREPPEAEFARLEHAMALCRALEDFPRPAKPGLAADLAAARSLAAAGAGLLAANFRLNHPHAPQALARRLTDWQRRYALTIPS